MRYFPPLQLSGSSDLFPFSLLVLLWELSEVRLIALATKLSLRCYRFFLSPFSLSTALRAF